MQFVSESLNYLRGQALNSGFGSATTAEDVATANKEQVAGKTIVITGANSGIGKEAALQLAKQGAHVVLACRSRHNAEATAEDIVAASPGAKVTAMECDLSELASVRKFANEFRAAKLPLHILINNAGVMACPRYETKDGVELQWGTNHLGHFVLTNELLPELKKNQPARVVILASEAHRHAYSKGIVLDDIEGKKFYQRWMTYGQSKLANILHAKELARRLKEEKVDITVNALHPGVIATNLARHMGPLPYLFPLAKPFFKTIPQGAATTVWAATSPALANVSGEYLSDCNVYRTNHKQAENMDLARKHWELSEEYANRI